MRPTAHFSALPPPAGATDTRGGRDHTARRWTDTTPRARAAVSPFAQTEPEVGRCLRILADVSHLGGGPTRAGLAWSDERRTAEGIARLRRRELAPRLRSLLDLDSDEEAEALLALDRAWLRYPHPEDTADVAALLPPDLHELGVQAALLRTPRWRRLGLTPPRVAP